MPMFLNKYKMYQNKLNVSPRLAKQNHFISLLEKEKQYENYMEDIEFNYEVVRRY